MDTSRGGVEVVHGLFKRRFPSIVTGLGSCLDDCRYNKYNQGDGYERNEEKPGDP